MAAPIVTVWRNRFGTDITAARPMDFAEIERVIGAAKPAADKDSLPLLKLARFGDKRAKPTKASKVGALRYDENVIEISGVEGDYDGEQIPMQHAAELLSAAGVAALLYTSARHTPERPRWRVMVSLSQPLAGCTEELKAQRDHWCGVLNALLGGVLEGESFVLSQSYFFGRIIGKPDPEIIRLSGVCIDQLENPPAPIIPAPTDKGAGDTQRDKTTASTDIADIAAARHIYHPTLRLTARYVSKGLPAAESAELVQAILLQHRAAWAAQPERWQECFDKAPRMAEGAAKFATGEQSATGGEEWPTPLNLFNELAAPPYARDTVPAVLSDYAVAYAESTGFDPSVTLGSAVVAAAAALSDGFSLVADSRTQWMQSARLWVLTIAKPGAGKTPGQRAMLKPLRELQDELVQSHAQHVATLGEDDPEPPLPRLVVGDTTIEALSEVLRHQPRGVLIATDEFESWLGSMDMYRRTGGASRDRGEWLALFDGGPHTIERIQRGSVHVPNWGTSILTAVTPSALSKVMRQLPEDGLLQRFIPIVARRQIITDGGTSGVEPLRSAYGQTLRRLYAMEPRAHKGAVPMAYAAQAYFREWRIENQRLQEALGSIAPALESHVAKYPTLLLRLALVYHCANIANLEDERARDPAAWPLPVETLLEAARFLRTASRHALALYASLSGSSAAFELAREIGRAVLATGGEVTERRLLIQRVRAFRGADPREQDAALRLLIDAGWLRPSQTGYDTARPARFDINPQVRTLFAREAGAEKARRAALREAIADSVTGRASDEAA